MFYIIATKWEEYLRGHLNAEDNNSSSPPPLNSVLFEQQRSLLMVLYVRIYTPDMYSVFSSFVIRSIYISVQMCIHWHYRFLL